jgi:hypothetical protein
MYAWRCENISSLGELIPPTSSERQGKESFCPKTMRTETGEVRRTVSIGVVNL